MPSRVIVSSRDLAESYFELAYRTRLYDLELKLKFGGSYVLSILIFCWSFRQSQKSLISLQDDKTFYPSPITSSELQFWGWTETRLHFQN